jgi:photosystem II stability/assembly factor-like uncharacterized protein
MCFNILTVTIVKFLILILYFCILSSTGYSQDKISYNWFPANTGGGGYITGIVQAVDNPDVIYARCDVGGVFKTTDRGRNWKTCNSGLSRWYNHSVQSMAVDPHNHRIIFRCSGDIRNKTLYGSIHRSSNGGNSWKEVCTEVGFYGNGGTRMFGELIAIDPFNGKNVFAAGYAGGIWVSSDSGFNWTYKLGSGERFGTVGVNPWFKNIYYAGTLSGKLYKSVDNGNSWSVVFQKEEKDFGFTEFAFEKKNKDIIYAACKGAGIYRSTDGGKSFSPVITAEHGIRPRVSR